MFFQHFAKPHRDLEREESLENIERRTLRIQGVQKEWEIHGRRIRSVLQDFLKSHPQELERVAGLLDKVAADWDLQMWLEDILYENPTVLKSPEELGRYVEFHEKNPSWWDKAVEAPMQALSDSLRDRIQDGTLKNVYDSGVGIFKGTYGFGKDAALLLPGLMEFSMQVANDQATRDNMKQLASSYVRWSLDLQFGSPEQKLKALEQMHKFCDAMLSQAWKSFTDGWEAAKKEDKRDEYIFKAGTRVAWELFTAWFSISKAPAAAKAAKEAAEGGLKQTMNVVSKAKEKVGEFRVTRRLRKQLPARLATKEEVVALLMELRPGLVQLLDHASPKVRDKIFKSLREFLPSDTMRGGAKLVGWEYIKSNPNAMERYVRESMKALESIAGKKPIKAYAFIKRGPKDIISDEARLSGLKGKKLFEPFVKEHWRGNRLGMGRYASVGEWKTAYLEVGASGTPPSLATHALFETEFLPKKGIDHDFLIVPSVRNSGGVNIFDRTLDEDAFRVLGELAF